MAWHVDLEYDTYEQARKSFEWDIPEDYNAAADFVRKHDDPKGSVALYQAYPDGYRDTWTFHDLDIRSNQIAHALESLGISRGDRIAVSLPQKPANLLTHLAAWKIGAITMPLSVLFGSDALRYRLQNSGASVAVVDKAVMDTLDDVRGDCPDLDHVIEVGSEDTENVIPFADFGVDSPRSYDIVDTTPDTPCVLIYTSGSTGPPKGVLHTHDVWLGHCPAFSMYFEHDIDQSVFWTPADWAWIGALGDLVFPAFHYGRPVVGYPMEGFDSGTAYELCEEFDVTDVFLPPTAIRMLMDVKEPLDTYDLNLKAICSGGEPLTPEILDWADESLAGVTVNELYGQTEANLLVTTCQDWFPAKAGSMGKPVPGHDVGIVDPETGEEKGPNEIGVIAVRRSNDPVIFEEYWNAPEKTAQSSVGKWHLTGDLGEYDEEGYFWFKSRDDDLIMTAGYRVGPGEVESAILEHDDVEQVGVIGVSDETRGEVIKAFVQPAMGVESTDELSKEITAMVKTDLAKYEYPRKIEFVDELPQTTTGKIQRKELRKREFDN